MTAKEYLVSQLRDPWPEPFSTETRIALSAYAIRMQQGLEGYSLSDAENLIRSCNLNEEFVNNCTDFLSDVAHYLTLAPLIPTYLED